MEFSFDEALYEVLERSRYDRLMGRSFDFRGMVEEAMTRFIEYLLQRFEFGLPEGSGINTDVVAIIFAVIGGLTLVLIIFLIIRRLRFKRRPAYDDFDGIYEEITKRNLTSVGWLSLSQTHADSGRYREAVRYRYIAVLLFLHEKNIIRIYAFKTNAQITNELASAKPSLAAYFAEITDCFHSTWFGFKPLDNTAFLEFCRIVEVLMG
jgi:hypothetical protein